jgi:hypothetical protein
MGTAKKQSRSKAKKSAARALPVASRSKLETRVKGAARGRAAKSRATATVLKGSARSAGKLAPKSAAKVGPKRTTKPKSAAKPKSAIQAKSAAKPAQAKNAAKSTQAKSGAKPKSAVQAKSAAKSKPASARAGSQANGVRKLAPSAKKVPVAKVRQRRDATGHLDPKYARDLRALSREHRDDQDDRAFFKRPRTGDDLAEELGEEAVETMTSGEDQSEHLTSQEVEEERGGPFVKTRASDEFARGTDRSNPRNATREPFPRT